MSPPPSRAVVSLFLGSVVAALGVAACSGKPDVGQSSAAVSRDRAHTSRAHLMPRRGAPAPRKMAAAVGAQLTYQGGPLLAGVKVATVFWGPGVSVTGQIDGFFTSITNSPYFDWLSEYDTNGQTIGRGSYLGAFTDPAPPASTSLQDSDIQTELESLIAAGKVPANDGNTLYMMYFPPGITITMSTGDQSCVAFCAYHSSYSRQNGSLAFYGVIPDQGGPCAGGCGGNATQFDNTTEVSSHEMIEAVTDPDVGNNDIGWYDDTNGEIGDICVGEGGNVAGYAVQLEWSNKNNNCIATDPTVPPPDAGATGADAGNPGTVVDATTPPADDAGVEPDAAPTPDTDAAPDDAGTSPMTDAGPSPTGNGNGSGNGGGKGNGNGSGGANGNGNATGSGGLKGNNSGPPSVGYSGEAPGGHSSGCSAAPTSSSSSGAPLPLLLGFVGALLAAAWRRRLRASASVS